MARASGEMVNRYDAINSRALETLIAQGTQLRQYSDDILQQAQETAFEMYEDLSADASFQEIYRSWKEFRQRIYGWNRLNELNVR